MKDTRQKINDILKSKAIPRILIVLMSISLILFINEMSKGYKQMKEEAYIEGQMFAISTASDLIGISEEEIKKIIFEN